MKYLSRLALATALSGTGCLETGTPISKRRTAAPVAVPTAARPDAASTPKCEYPTNTTIGGNPATLYGSAEDLASQRCWPGRAVIQSPESIEAKIFSYYPNGNIRKVDTDKENDGSIDTSEMYDPDGRTVNGFVEIGYHPGSDIRKEERAFTVDKSGKKMIATSQYDSQGRLISQANLSYDKGVRKVTLEKYGYDVDGERRLLETLINGVKQ
ncbi:hypothetical protein COV20_05305 [Candidatus Woesearchaeota archaeon CG10_big_fil_rev_8_21_14_0_10_45_16]|nr:MAG: hypothetical protein COV20_05305 [Candidatus Woesearchaeota archaeon CG10_big_fil_rev_8_21_14_0_10_45_16]